MYINILMELNFEIIMNYNKSTDNKNLFRFNESFLNDTSYLYSYPIKIPKSENHTTDRGMYSLNRLVQIFQNSEGIFIDKNKKIVKDDDVYIVSYPDNDINSMSILFFKLDELVNSRKNHEKSSDNISCRFSLLFKNNDVVNLIDVIDKNCFYKTVTDRCIPYTSIYKILCIKTGKEYLMTSSLNPEKNDVMYSVGLPYDHPFCIGINKNAVINRFDKSYTHKKTNKKRKRNQESDDGFPELFLPKVFSTSKFLD